MNDGQSTHFQSASYYQPLAPKTSGPNIAIWSLVNTFGFKAIANVISNDSRAASTDIHHADRSAGSGSIVAANGVI